MKKVLNLLIIIAYCNVYFACTSTKHTTDSASELTTNYDRNLVVVTKNSDRFSFKSNTYHAIGDTLIGQGCALIGDEEQKVERINIAMSDISYGIYNEEQISTWSYVGMGLVGASIITIAIMNDSNDLKKTSHIYQNP